MQERKQTVWFCMHAFVGDSWITKDLTGQVLRAGVRRPSDHPSLFSGLIGHAWGWGKIGLSLSTEERHLSVGKWGRWQRAKRQKRLRRGLSLFCLELGPSTTMKCSLDTQLSTPLWSCTIREKRPLFLPGISTSAWNLDSNSAASTSFICSTCLQITALC